MTTTVTLAVPCIYCKDSYNITANQEDLMDWRAGKLIQYALPYLNLHERELLISNTCQSCFDDIFPLYCGDCLVPIKECHHASM